MADYVVVLITAGSLKEAETIAYALVEDRLAASVNMLAACRSIFRWEGEVHKEHEVMMVAKTRRETAKRLIQRVLELHSYDIPSVVTLPIESGPAMYLQWIGEQVDP